MLTRARYLVHRLRPGLLPLPLTIKNIYSILYVRTVRLRCWLSSARRQLALSRGQLASAVSPRRAPLSPVEDRGQRAAFLRCQTGRDARPYASARTALPSAER